jgi:hypothetical protein
VGVSGSLFPNQRDAVTFEAIPHDIHEQRGASEAEEVNDEMEAQRNKRVTKLHYEGLSD